MYYFLGQSLHASLPDLGILTLCRALVQAASSPLSGILGDRVDRTLLVTTGCTLWGIMTSAIGASTSLHQAMIACAFNGFGLALVLPSIASLVADSTPSGERGRAFGVMGLTSSLGAMAGALFATNVGGIMPFGIEGWRFAFHAVAAVSLATAYLVRRYAIDPRRPLGNQKDDRYNDQKDGGNKQEGPHLEGSRPRSSHETSSSSPPLWNNVATVLKIRSFQVIVLQGIVGSIPWQSMVMFTLWLQLLGFSNLQTSLLVATFACGGALGGLLGGALGDAAARRAPHRGRIFIAQTSVFLGLPLSVLLLKGLPIPNPAVHSDLVDMNTPTTSVHVVLYGLVLMVMGLSISWSGANNSAMFAELVPERLRTQIYAFDRSFEGAVGACGAPLVGVAAERLFGFKGSIAAAVAQGPRERALAAHALSSALLLCLLVPWILCFLSYSLLYLTFPLDRLAASKLMGRGGSGELELRFNGSLVETSSGGEGTGKYVQMSKRSRLPLE